MNNDDITLEELHEGLREAKTSYMLYEDKDGNWRGFTVKDKKLVQVRQVDPTTVLTMLITHE